jgi:hypothetical protein
MLDDFRTVEDLVIHLDCTLKNLGNQSNVDHKLEQIRLEILDLFGDFDIKVEAIMLDKFLTVKDLATHLTETAEIAGTSLQVDYKGKVTSVLIKVKNKLSQLIGKFFRGINIDENPMCNISIIIGLVEC